MKSIVLLWPINIYYSPSISILYQSKILKSGGFEPTVIFSNLLFGNDNMSLPDFARENPAQSFQKVLQEVEKANPDLLFIGGWRKDTPFVDIFAKLFKKRHPDTPIVHGGHNATFIPEEVLDLTPEIDYLIIGEPEFTLLNLIQALKDKTPISIVKGLAWSGKKGFQRTERSEPVDLDSLPLIDYEEVRGNLPSRFDIRSSCGCIMSCDFCNLYRMWKHPRYQSTSNVLSQIRHLDRKYGLTYTHFIDEMFMNKVDRAKKLAQRIHDEFPSLEWGGMIRNEFVSEGNIRVLSKAGLKNAAVGIESRNPKILRFLNKTPDPESYIARIPKTLSIMKKYLHTLEVGLISATPVENERDIIDLIDFMKETKRDKGNLQTLKLAIGKLNVFPGTRLWEQVEDGKLELLKTQIRFNPYETYTEKKYLEQVWPSARHFMIMNPNFKDMQEFKSLYELTVEEAK